MRRMLMLLALSGMAASLQYANSQKGAMGQIKITGKVISDVYRSTVDGPPTQ